MGLNGKTNLKESLQPPDLENTLSKKDNQLAQTPPFDSRVRALSSVPVRLFPNNDVGLFILDLRHGFRKAANYRADYLAEALADGLGSNPRQGWV